MTPRVEAVIASCAGAMKAGLADCADGGPRAYRHLHPSTRLALVSRQLVTPAGWLTDLGLDVLEALREKEAVS